MGRSSKPAELKRAQGNPGKRAIAETPDAVPAVTRTAPAELNAVGKRAWKELAPLLASINFLRRTDQPALTRYCNHVARYWRLEQKIRKEGETYWTESRHGKMERVNPKLRAQLEVERRMESLEDRLGLSTRARQQILQAMAARPAQLPLGDGAPPPPADAESPIGLLALGGARVH